MKPIKKIALLHDVCGVGRAALTNMLPVLSILGIETCPIPTMLLSTHTGGYGSPAMYQVPTAYVKASADHYVKEQIVFDAIFIGYLGDVDMVAGVQYFIAQFPETLVVLDPIMGDHGRYYSNFDATYGAAMNCLIKSADIILPNLTEACLISKVPYLTDYNLNWVEQLCSSLSKAGAKKVIITSVSIDEHKKGIAIYDENQLTFLNNDSIDSEYHGTGDVFDGVFMGKLLKGSSIIEAVICAHEFVVACITESNQYVYPEREGLMIENNLHMLV